MIAKLYSKARATTLTGYKFTATFSEKKVHCSQVSNGNKNRLDHESFYQSNMERLLHLSPEDCKKLIKTNKPYTKYRHNQKTYKFSSFFSGLAHQAELEKHQGPIRLDTKFPFHGVRFRHEYRKLNRTPDGHISLTH